MECNVDFFSITFCHHLILFLNYRYCAFAVLNLSPHQPVEIALFLQVHVSSVRKASSHSPALMIKRRSHQKSCTAAMITRSLYSILCIIQSQRNTGKRRRSTSNLILHTAVARPGKLPRRELNRGKWCRNTSKKQQARTIDRNQTSSNSLQTINDDR